MSTHPSILIIGGGVSGLSAGVYAQLNGFRTTLLEKHTIVGGECTGWDRQGFHIDNCVHWMTGTSPKKRLHKVWETVGALGPDIPIIQNDAFLRVDGKNGAQHFVWKDLNRMKADMLKLAPEDAKTIEKLIDAVDRYQDIEVFTKPIEQNNLKDIIGIIKMLRRALSANLKYSQMSIPELRDMFKNPLLRRSMDVYLPKQYYAEALLYMYATFVSGNGALPAGGSKAMAMRMQKRFEDLGGTVRTGCGVEKVLVENGQAVGVLLSNGETFKADYVVAACDIHITLEKLLNNQYPDKYFHKRISNKKRYPTFSNVGVYLGCDVRPEGMPDTVAFEFEPFRLGKEEARVMLAKHYMYEPTFAPEGQMVMQALLHQYESDFDYWEDLYLNNRAAYKAEKERVGQEVLKRIEEHFPELAGHLKVVEIITPYSLHRYTGAYKGAYMSFISTKGQRPSQFHHGRIKGLSHFYLAGQWLQSPGGLPNAVVTGKFAIQRLCKDINRPFVEEYKPTEQK